MPIITPQAIEKIFTQPGRNWTPLEAIQVKEWLFENAQLHYLLHLCSLRLGTGASEQDVEDAFSQFYTYRLDSVILLYDPKREKRKSFWNYLLMCLERDCFRCSRKLQKKSLREYPLVDIEPGEEVGINPEYLSGDLQEPLQKSPEGATTVKQALTALERCLEFLPANHRQAFLLLVVQEISDKEASQVMNSPPGTVRVWAARARAALKNCMNREGWDG
jgi:RNA polymerase sigma factor (sigma-70 family)